MDDWLDWLVPMRDHLLDLQRDRSQPLKARLRAFLLTAYAAQSLLDEEDMEGLAAFCAAPQAIPVDFGGDTGSWEPAVRQCLLDLEILEPDWRDLLDRWAGEPPVPFAPQEPEKLERIAVYFAFRHLLKAVNDGDLLGRAQFCVLGVLTADRLSRLSGLPEALRLFSREIEHDEDNLTALLEAFWQRPELSLSVFLAPLAE